MHPRTDRAFPGWAVARAAFVVAVFGWGVGFYGPPVFLQAIHAERGWPIPLISAAVTTHFLLGAVVVARLDALHARFGVVAVTRAGAAASALGVLGWALATEPWQLFVATLPSGFGWATTGAAAINAFVSPWFVRRRPAALGFAYNGASVGGVMLTPLWVALIAGLGFPGAAAVIGAAMVATLFWLAGRGFRHGPAALGLRPDGDAADVPVAAPHIVAALPGRALWRSRAFASLAMATAFGLFAQIGLIAHLFSLLVPRVGDAAAGLIGAWATICAIAGRTLLGWLMPPDADRRRVAAGNYALQVAGSAFLLLGTTGGGLPALLLGVTLFGLGLGNTTSLPPLIAQRDFAAVDVGRAVALVTALSQATYAFAPAAFGLLRSGADDDGAMLFAAAAMVQLVAASLLLARGWIGR